MNWVRRLSISLTIVFFAACCGAVLLFNWSALGWKAYSVPTGSMRPGMPPGSVVLVHRVPYPALKVGDVITFANPLHSGTTTTHRIIKSFKLDGRIPTYNTKGDANPSADPFTVVGGQIVGKAVWHTPHIGTWLNWSKTWAGLAALVYLPAFLIMFGAAQDMADYLHKFQVYELRVMPKLKKRRPGRRLVSAAISLSVMTLVYGAVAWPVHALLRSNTVSLTNNRLSVAPRPSQCTANGTNTNVNITGNGSGSNTNNVTVTNGTSQTATTGSASVSNNTTGGNATSGNATNINCTNTTITITNH